MFGRKGKKPREPDVVNIQAEGQVRITLSNAATPINDAEQAAHMLLATAQEQLDLRPSDEGYKIIVPVIYKDVSEGELTVFLFSTAPQYGLRISPADPKQRTVTKVHTTP